MSLMMISVMISTKRILSLFFFLVVQHNREGAETPLMAFFLFVCVCDDIMMMSQERCRSSFFSRVCRRGKKEV